MPSNITLRYCSTEDIANFAPHFNSDAGYSPDTISGYIRRSEATIRRELGKAFPQIMNQTTWVSPTTTPEIICDLAIELTIKMLEYNWACKNTDIIPSPKTFMEPIYNGIWGLRGYNNYGRTVELSALYNRTGAVINPVTASPYITTEETDQEITPDVYAVGSILDGNEPTTYGTLSSYRMPDGRF